MTDRTKTICPQIIDLEGIKLGEIETHRYHDVKNYEVEKNYCIL